MATNNTRAQINNMPEMTESLENLAAAALQEQTMMAALTDAVAKLTNKLETQDAEIRRLKSTNNAGQSQNRCNKNPPPNTRTRPDRGVWESNTNYCWSQGWHIAKDHDSERCNAKKPGHVNTANRANTMGGSDKNKDRALALAP